jgi:hypothetical protein
MPDASNTTVFVWPWRGTAALPDAARAVFDARGLSELLLDGVRTETLEVRGLADDEEPDRILMIHDENAAGGRYAYHDLIEALHDGGVNVYARNDKGAEYDAGWELRPSGGKMVERSMSEVFDVTMVSGGELLEECRRHVPGARTLSDIPPTELRAAVLELFVEPDLPRAILEES